MRRAGCRPRSGSHANRCHRDRGRHRSRCEPARGKHPGCCSGPDPQNRWVAKEDEVRLSDTRGSPERQRPHLPSRSDTRVEARAAARIDLALRLTAVAVGHERDRHVARTVVHVVHRDAGRGDDVVIRVSDENQNVVAGSDLHCRRRANRHCQERDEGEPGQSRPTFLALAPSYSPFVIPSCCRRPTGESCSLGQNLCRQLGAIDVVLDGLAEDRLETLRPCFQPRALSLSTFGGTRSISS